jgi:hypothetical protein
MSMTSSDSLRGDLLAQLKTLRETIWLDKCAKAEIEQWLENFDGQAIGDARLEQDHALYMLANFAYYGLPEIRILLRSAFREHVRYPIFQEARAELGGSLDPVLVRPVAARVLNATRFYGMGTPSESGGVMLYLFRTVNDLSKLHFPEHHEIFVGNQRGLDGRLSDPSVTRYVFLDDICASGQQAKQYASGLVKDIRSAAAAEGNKVYIQYITLFAFADAMRSVAQTGFDSVDSVHVLGDSAKIFDPDGPYRNPPTGLDRAVGESVAGHYGSIAVPQHPLGYRNSQLALGFAYNTPDNTLPIFWADGKNSRAGSWVPIFHRDGKH